MPAHRNIVGISLIIDSIRTRSSPKICGGHNPCLEKRGCLFLLLNNRFLFLAVVAGKRIDYTGGIDLTDEMYALKLLNHPAAGRGSPDFPVLNVLLCQLRPFYAV
jgi:hypothetical protein